MQETNIICDNSLIFPCIFCSRQTELLSQTWVDGLQESVDEDGRIKTLSFNHLFPYNEYSYSQHCPLFIFSANVKENLFNNQQLLKLRIISILLMTFSFDSGIQGDVGSRSLLGVQGFIIQRTFSEMFTEISFVLQLIDWILPPSISVCWVRRRQELKVVY